MPTDPRISGGNNPAVVAALNQSRTGPQQGTPAQLPGGPTGPPQGPAQAGAGMPQQGMPADIGSTLQQVMQLAMQGQDVGPMLAQVFQSYLKGGAAPQDSQALTQFVQMYAQAKPQMPEVQQDQIESFLATVESVGSDNPQATPQSSPMDPQSVGPQGPR